MAGDKNQPPGSYLCDKMRTGGRDAEDFCQYENICVSACLCTVSGRTGGCRMKLMNSRSRGIYLAVLCVLTYGTVYLCRINISAAVEKMADGFGTSVAAVGIFGSLQSLIYACGQFVNGYFINRRRSRLIIGFAAFGSGLINLISESICLNCIRSSFFKPYPNR